MRIYWVLGPSPIKRRVNVMLLDIMISPEKNLMLSMVNINDYVYLLQNCRVQRTVSETW